jgi:putative aldouronate transport system substrate-binding protein
VMPPIGDLGGTRVVFPVDRGFSVAASYKDPDGFFDFLNWTLTDGSSFRRWGIEGKTYKSVNGQRQPIPDEQRDPQFRRPQMEPLGFLAPFSENLDWEQVRLNYQSAGLEADFAWVRSTFDQYQKLQYPDWANPAVITPTEASKGTQIYENTMQGVVSGVVINNQTTTADWRNAVKKWEAAGGSQIIAERNRLQKDKSKPDYLK